MKKRVTGLFLALAMALSLFAACGEAAQSSTPGATLQTVRAAGLKGPTTMGMLKQMADNDALSESERPFEFTVYGAADEITPLLVNGNLDVAAIPANLAAVLYNKTQGEVQVVAVNTLGVLQVLVTGAEVSSLEDLRGKTVYMTGKGTVPEYTFSYILAENGLTPGVDVFLEFKSEPAEVGALLAAAAQDGEEMFAVLPNPYATAVCMQNEGVSAVIALADEYTALTGEEMVTGVLVARRGFIEECPQEFANFMAAYEASIAFAQTEIEQTAQLVVDYEILGAVPLAQKALPECNITYIAGEEMKNILSSYYSILYAANPASVGGETPAEDFYYQK